MIFPEVVITSADREKYRAYTQGAIFGIKLIEQLSTDVLFQIIEEGPELVEVANHMDRFDEGFYGFAQGLKTNHSWVLARAAEALYMRNEIDAKTLDRVCN